MHRILAFAICAILLAACSDRSAPKGNSAYDQERKALDAAASIGTSAAVDQFIAEHPDSVWLPIAVYRRDRAALEEAKQVGTRDAFQDFLRRYPKSDWADQARYFLQYGVQGGEKKG